MEQGASEKHEGNDYFQNELDSEPMGALVDLRVKIAIDIVKGGLLSRLAAEGAPGEVLAARALDCAASLVKAGEKVGWIKPLPDGPDMSRSLIRRARRIVQFNVEQQLEGNRQMKEAAGRVAVPQPVFGKPPN